MVRALRIALLFNLLVISVASAQPAVEGTSTIGSVATGRTIIVVDESGRETQGKLVRFTPDHLTMAVKNRDMDFDVPNVSVVYERTNSVKKGMILGALSGPALGIVAATDGGPEAFYIVTVVFGAIGFAIGTAIDAAIPERRLIYQKGQLAAGPRGAEGFSFTAAGRKVIVVDRSGTESRGRLLHIGSDDVTVTIDGRARTFAREQVTAIYERGDSKKNGMLIGFAAGVATGMVTGASKTRCGRNYGGGGIIQAPSYYSPCSGEERLKQGLREGLGLGLVGTGLGAAIDALIPGRRLIYQRPEDAAATTTFTIVPVLAPSRIGVMTSVSW